MQEINARSIVSLISTYLYGIDVCLEKLEAIGVTDKDDSMHLLLELMYREHCDLQDLVKVISTNSN